MARQRMTREEAILDIMESAPWIKRPEAEGMVDKNIGDDPNYYKLEKEGASEEFDQEESIKEIKEGSKFDPLSSEFDDDAWFKDYSYLNREEPKEETKEERLERQIEHFNNMRSHVSDLDEDYLLDDAPRDHWEQGLQSRPDEREMTQMVEALQRQAMQQGNVGDTTQLPIGQFSNQGFPMTPAGPNPIIQALQNQNQMGRPGMDVNSLRPGTNAPIMQSGVNPLMGIGGGNPSWGAGTWYPYGR